jgi:uracil-DNA glycosylase family 4
MVVRKEPPAVNMYANEHPMQAVKVRSPNIKRRWEKHYRAWSKCDRCPLHHLARCHVLGRGRLPVDVLFVGEAPGDVEDTRGLPFVGPAGGVLDKIIDAVSHKLRKPFTYAITNIVACRPFPRGEAIAVPSKEAIEACRPRLEEFIALAKPQLLVVLGKTAAEHLPRTGLDMPIIECWHPSYILRNGGASSTQFTETVSKLATVFKRVFDGEE